MAKNNLPIIIIAVVALIAVAGLESPTFILYGGVEVAANETNIQGQCWTLADERCVRQNVNLLNLTTTGRLICPELYYDIEINCKQAFDLIPEIRKPKLNCYYAQGDMCILEQFDDNCPTTYFKTKESCETSLIDFAFSAKRLFSSRKTLILAGIGGVALLLMGLNFWRKQ